MFYQKMYLATYILLADDRDDVAIYHEQMN